MNEEIYLVFKILFFTIRIPVVMLEPDVNKINHYAASLKNIHIQSKIEYLTDSGKVIIESSNTNNTLEKGYLKIFNKNMYSLENKKNFNVENDNPHLANTKSFKTDPMTIELTNDMEKSNKNNTDNISVNLGNSDNRNTIKNSIIFLKKSYYILSRILVLMDNSPFISYEYSEFEKVPLVLQLLFHIPLILTGSVILIIVLTLEPEYDVSEIKNKIEKLPSIIYKEELSLPDCSICLDGFAAGECTRILKCNHGFHKSCIDGWLVSSLRCPICRMKIINVPGSYRSEDFPTHYYA